MAYTAANIQTALLQSLGASISADTAKVAAITKEIKMAYVEVAQIMQSEDMTYDQPNLLWFMLGMYKGTIVAAGITEEAIHLYKVYHDFLDLVMDNRLQDTKTSEPA